LIFYFSYSCNTFLLFSSPATDGGRLRGGVKKFFYHNSSSFHYLGALPFAQRSRRMRRFHRSDSEGENVAERPTSYLGRGGRGAQRRSA